VRFRAERAGERVVLHPMAGGGREHPDL
jgi:hypothetical protein